MLLLWGPLKSVISDILSEISEESFKLSELLIGHNSELSEHVLVFVIFNLLLNWNL